MLIALLIMLREGIEAALIVGIVASFLKQSGHSELMPKVWLGVFLAAAMCLGIGYGIHSVTGEIPQKEQELVVGVIGLVAVAMLTYMILWMKKAARSMKQHLQDSVQSALNHGSGQGWALVGMAFLAVAREGLESVFFLLAVFQQSPTWSMPIGAVLGLLAAVVIGTLIYQGGMRLNLAKFFRWTGAFLIVVAEASSSLVCHLHTPRAGARMPFGRPVCWPVHFAHCMRQAYGMRCRTSLSIHRNICMKTAL